MGRKRPPPKPPDPRRWLDAEDVTGFKNEETGFQQSPVHRLEVTIPNPVGDYVRTALYTQVIVHSGKKSVNRYILVFGWEQKGTDDPPDRVAVVMVEPKQRRIVERALKEAYALMEHVCFWEWGIASAQ